MYVACKIYFWTVKSWLPWVGLYLGPLVCFQNYERKNLDFFTCGRESYLGNLYPSLIEKIGFPFWKKIKRIFKGQKKFCSSKFLPIKIDKTELSFLKNGSDNSSKCQRIHSNKFHNEMIVANIFASKNILECKVGCLGPQRGRLPSVTQQMTNNGRSSRCRLLCQKNCFERFL